MIQTDICTITVIYASADVGSTIIKGNNLMLKYRAPAIRSLKVVQMCMFSIAHLVPDHHVTTLIFYTVCGLAHVLVRLFHRQPRDVRAVLCVLACVHPGIT